MRRDIMVIAYVGSKREVGNYLNKAFLDVQPVTSAIVDGNRTPKVRFIFNTLNAFVTTKMAVPNRSKI